MAMANEPLGTATLIKAASILFAAVQCFDGNGLPGQRHSVFTSIFAQDTIASSAYNSLQISLTSALPAACNSRQHTRGVSR